jgi:hypothetical protein
MSHAKTLETLMTLGMLPGLTKDAQLHTFDEPPVDGEWSTTMQDAFAKAQVAAAQKKSKQPAGQNGQ